MTPFILTQIASRSSPLSSLTVLSCQLMRFDIKLFLLAVVLHEAGAYKILVYNVKIGHSHSNYLGLVADTLVEAGHNVTSLIPIIDPSLKDGTTKSKVIHVPQDSRITESVDMMTGKSKNAGPDFWEMKTNAITIFLVGLMFRDMFCPQCETTLNHPGLVEQLKNEHFDVVLSENFDFCGTGLAHAIGASLILVSTSSISEQITQDIGMPLVPSFNPSYTISNFDLHSLWSRMENVYHTLMSMQELRPAQHCIDGLLKTKFGADYPTVSEQTANSAFVLTNSEPFIDFARPLLRKVVDLGGIGVKAPKPLDKYWNDVLSLRKQTVLVSFGSVAKSYTMSIERKRTLLKMFARFPEMTFIWKYEMPEDEFSKNETAKLKNVILSKWMPQSDLLNDPRLTAFVSHAGMGSCQEVAARGIPTLFIPLFGDQPRNAAMMQYNGLALALDKFDALDADKLTDAVRRLISSDSIRANAKKSAAMLARKPFAPKELLIKHVEFAAEFGVPKSLIPRGLQLGWIEYFLVDVILVALTAILLLTSLVFFVTVKIVRRIFGVQKISQKVKEN